MIIQVLGEREIGVSIDHAVANMPGEESRREVSNEDQKMRETAEARTDDDGQYSDDMRLRQEK